MHKPVKSRGVGILDHFRDHHSLASDSADDRDLAAGSRPADSGRILAAVVIGASAVPVVRFAADVSFVNFDLASERNVTLHCGPPAMADVPASAPVSTRAFAEHHAPDL